MNFPATVLSLVLLTCFGCSMNIQTEPLSPLDEPGSVACEFVGQLEMPLPYSLTSVARIPGSNSISSFQMLTQEVGFGLGSTSAGGYPYLIKTTDGGVTWDQKSPAVSQYPRSLFFLNESEGYITVHDVTGCPDACQDRCILLRTTDGGDSWEEIHLPNLSGTLYHLQADREGNLYASLFTPEQTTLVKSTDKGQTFDILYENEQYAFSDSRFSFAIHDDLIYANGKEDMIFVVSTDGTLVDIVRTGVFGSIIDMAVLSSDILLVNVGQQLLLSKDGGNSWATIREGNAAIVDADLGDGEDLEALVLHTTGYCPTDYVRAIDVFSYTDDDGQTWESGGASENISLDFARQLGGLDESFGLMILDNMVYKVSQ